MLTNYLIVDLESTGREDAKPFVKPDSRLVDPAKIQASITDRCERLSVDINGARIVTLGTALVRADTERGWLPDVSVCREWQDERLALKDFWQTWLVANKPALVGFFNRPFDIPLIIRRSQMFGLSTPRLSLARYHKGDVFDLYDELCFHEYGRDGVVPKDMDTFCKLFGIAVEDQHTGADVPGLIAAGDYESVAKHNLADLVRIAKLGERIGVLAGVKEAAVTR